MNKLIVFFSLFLFGFTVEAQDIVSLNSGKKISGKIIEMDSLRNIKLETVDSLTITIKGTDVKKVDHQLHSNFQIFNYPAGTKFIYSQISTGKFLGVETTSHVKTEKEIISNKNNIIKLKISNSFGGSINTANDGLYISWGGAKLLNDKIIYMSGSELCVYEEGSDKGIAYPINPTIDSTYPDINISLVDKNDFQQSSLRESYSNIRVTGKETISTSAGTFDCYIFSYDISHKKGGKIIGNTKCWISNSTGLIKSESNFKLAHTLIITQLEAVY